MVSSKVKVSIPAIGLALCTVLGSGIAHAAYPVTGAIGFAYHNSGGSNKWAQQ